MADMKALRSSVANMCADLVASVGVPFASTTELQRQMLACFAFGMTFAIGRTEHLTPPEVQALSITMLMDAFKYSGHQAAAFSSHLIESAGGTGNPAIQAIIHRGIDGHRQWSSGQILELSKNINPVFQTVGDR